MDNQLTEKRRYQLISVLIHLVIILLFSWPLFKTVIEEWGAPVILVQLEAPDQQVMRTPVIPGNSSQRNEGENQQPLKKKNLQTIAETSNSFPSHSKENTKTTISPVKEEVPEASNDKVELVAAKDPYQINSAQENKLPDAAPTQEEFTRLKEEYSSYLKQHEPAEPNGNGSKEIESPKEGPLVPLQESIVSIGGDLKGRSVIQYPNLKDNSQKKGLVIVKICVDSRGIVRTARYTQKGSTTTDLYLVDLAVGAARKYIFSTSAADRQCGTIAFDFQLK